VDFSRNGQWVTYVGVPEGTLWRSKLDGTEKLQLTFAPMVAYLPRRSPDGKRIAFEAIFTSKPWTMYTVSADGGDLREIRPWPGDPNWSADGNSLVLSTAPLVFDPGASTKSTIQVLDLRSGQISTLPASEGFYSPRWSPDGRYIAALKADTNTLRIFDLSSRNGLSWVRSESLIRTGHSTQNTYAFGPWRGMRGGSVVFLLLMPNSTDWEA